MPENQTGAGWKGPNPCKSSCNPQLNWRSRSVDVGQRLVVAHAMRSKMAPLLTALDWSRRYQTRALISNYKLSRCFFFTSAQSRKAAAAFSTCNWKIKNAGTSQSEKCKFLFDCLFRSKKESRTKNLKFLNSSHSQLLGEQKSVFFAQLFCEPSLSAFLNTIFLRKIARQ